jgi:hypothetical protein
MLLILRMVDKGLWEGSIVKFIGRLRLDCWRREETSLTVEGRCLQVPTLSHYLLALYCCFTSTCISREMTGTALLGAACCSKVLRTWHKIWLGLIRHEPLFTIVCINRAAHAWSLSIYKKAFILFWKAAFTRSIVIAYEWWVHLVDLNYVDLMVVVVMCWTHSIIIETAFNSLSRRMLTLHDFISTI